MRRVAIAVLAVVVAVVLFVVLFTFRGRQYEWVMLNRFGKLVENPTTIAYGWHLCWPTDRVVRLDKRLHLYQSALEQTGTGGRETLSVQVFAAWRITEPVRFYQSMGGGSDVEAQKVINTKVMGTAKAKIGERTLEEFFNVDEKQVQTTNLENAVRDEVNADIRKNEQGIEVAQVGFARMAFPPEIAGPVYTRMAAERARQAERFKAEGETEATRIRAQADEAALKTRADAGREAAKIRSDADSEALDILAKSQEAPGAMDFYRFMKEIEMFKNSMGPRTILILEAGKSIPEQVGLLQQKVVGPATQPLNK